MVHEAGRTKVTYAGTTVSGAGSAKTTGGRNGARGRASAPAQSSVRTIASGCAVFNESGSTARARRYCPGPHTGSDSGKRNDMACTSKGEIERDAEPSMSARPSSVPSNTA